jgi:diguanylate cyclase (GGDEF)-like protein
MPQPKILLIEGDPEEAAVLHEHLRGDNYEVKPIERGADALDVAKSFRPHLIILDVDLPDIDAFAIAQTLKRDPETALIPYIFLTAEKRKISDKEKGFDLGAFDYILKPYDPDDLLIRVKAIISRTRILQSALPTISTLDLKKIELLKRLSETPDKELIPLPDINSSFGYSYPEAQNIFAASAAETDQHLVDLALRGCLEKSFHTNVHLCPFCNVYNLNFIEVCPDCKNPDITMTELIHHFKCAYVGPKQEFQRGMQLICPKCEGVLRHIGVDYEKPSESFVCNVCAVVFSEAEVNCFCLSCRKQFKLAEAILRSVNRYKITQRGKMAAATGNLYEVAFDQAFIDTGLEILNFKYFYTKSQEELNRFKRYDRPLTLMMVGVHYFDEYLRLKGPNEAGKLLRNVTQCLKEAIRDTDFLARFEESTFAILLPETPIEQARALADRLKEQIRVKNIPIDETDRRIRLHVATIDCTNKKATVRELIAQVHSKMLENEVS